MPLLDLNFVNRPARVPADVCSFLREARRRIRRFNRQHLVPGFIPCDFERTYRVLHALAADLAPGKLFCEWGSGFGIVACLAAMLDYDACGIEIDGGLVDAAQELADDFGLPVQFIQGSFIPPGGETEVLADGAFAWLSTDRTDAYSELGLDADDFDVIFAYPWPDEEQLTGTLFERWAGPEALLLTYHGSDEFCLRRKTNRISRQAAKAQRRREPG